MVASIRTCMSGMLPDGDTEDISQRLHLVHRPHECFQKIRDRAHKIEGFDST
jgi:hypothetical protein